MSYTSLKAVFGHDNRVEGGSGRARLPTRLNGELVQAPQLPQVDQVVVLEAGESRKGEALQRVGSMHLVQALIAELIAKYYLQVS